MARAFLLVGIVGGLACLDACSSNGGKPASAAGAAGASTAGAAGASTAGAAGTSTAGVAGAGAAGSGLSGDGAAGSATSDAAGAAGGANAAGAGGTVDGGAAGMGADGAAGAGAAGTTGSAGAAGGGAVDLTKVARTTGCGMDPGQAVGTLVMGQLMTMGVKDANCADAKCGAWSYTRDYWVKLPTGYLSSKAYPLVFEGPGCGGVGSALYNIPAFDTSVIRVGLSPSKDAQAFHATNPGQGCFDDKEGDDSVDFVFYEKLWDKLAGQLCFDENRVFAAGNSSGAWLANELGCKYSGDATHPIRGIMAHDGGLPTQAMYAPTCTAKPMAGLWFSELDDPGDPPSPFSYSIPAISRALKVNGCTPDGVSYFNAMFEDFPTGGGNSPSLCKRIQGCPDLFPLVVCLLPGSAHHTGDDESVVPAFSTFAALFEAAPLLAP